MNLLVLENAVGLVTDAAILTLVEVMVKRYPMFNLVGGAQLRTQLTEEMMIAEGGVRRRVEALEVVSWRLKL